MFTLPIEEFEIAVPWGSISVKTWGLKSNSPVLVIHGIQDNIGSFDRLIPHLPKGFYYFCIDLPGHGKSSAFPSGIPLEFFNYVYSVKLVIDYLSWKTVILIGHSLGAQISAFFGSLYPEIILKVVLIDGLTPIVIPEERSVLHLKAIFNSLQNLEKSLSSKIPPSYSYEEAYDRLVKNRVTQLTKEGAEALIKRSLKPSGDGFMFSTDQRLKLRLRPILTMKQMKMIISNMKFPTLMIVAMDTYNLLDSVSEELYHERLNELFLKLPTFKFVLVEGNHDVHINYPERVAPLINSFLLQPNRSSL